MLHRLIDQGSASTAAGKGRVSGFQSSLMRPARPRETKEALGAASAHASYCNLATTVPSTIIQRHAVSLRQLRTAVVVHNVSYVQNFSTFAKGHIYAGLGQLVIVVGLASFEPPLVRTSVAVPAYGCTTKAYASISTRRLAHLLLASGKAVV